MISKVVSRAFKAAPLLKKATTTLSIIQMPVRTFTTEADIQRAKQKLSKSLVKEIKYEEENYQIDDSVQVKSLETHDFLNYSRLELLETVRFLPERC